MGVSLSRRKEESGLTNAPDLSIKMKAQMWPWDLVSRHLHNIFCIYFQQLN